uniref:Uncharacterized protein n=1 Tax=Rangifer tarandus platyrhynchus TaxID=3082113 RepID=A0ACB0EE28_RANTA|nr:unnamed protein product [Rangifer tarandus platyrhynchus]
MRIYSVLTFMAYCCLLKAFTITVPKDLYVVEYGSNVTLECRFPVDKQLNLLVLVVYWEMEDKKIIQFVNGKEDLNVQHSSYHGRAQLLKDQLSLGKAALQITDVKLQDAGVYCCLISYGGADYKRITLKVNASYKKIRTRHLKVPGTDEVELTCQAEGYPLAEVSWPNISIPAITSHTKTSEGLYQVTSVLRLKPHPGRNFTCVFWNADMKELTSATIVQGPMEDPKIPPSSLLHVFILFFIIAFMFIATMVALRKRLWQKLYPGEDATKRSATMVRKEEDRAVRFPLEKKNQGNHMQRVEQRTETPEPSSVNCSYCPDEPPRAREEEDLAQGREWLLDPLGKGSPGLSHEI